MKLTTIALVTALAVSSTAALAQGPSLGQGTVTAPSVGSYQTTVGVSNVVPTWKNTQGTAATKKPKTSAVIQNASGRKSGVHQ